MSGNMTPNLYFKLQIDVAVHSFNVHELNMPVPPKHSSNFSYYNIFAIIA